MAEKEKIQEVPEGWGIKVMDNLCEILDNKRVPISDENRQFMKGDIPYYGANGVVDYINEFIFDEDLILLAEDGGHFEEWMTKPIAYRVSGKSWVNNHAHVLRNKDGVSLGFVFYNLEHRNIIYYISGGTRGKLNQSQLRSMPVLIPQSLIEQTQIASVISTCDEAIEKSDAKIEKLKRIKQGLMQDLFHYGIDENGQMRSEATHRFKESPLGRIPEEWAVVELRKHTSIIGGFAFKSQDFKDDGIQLIKIGNLYDNKLSLDREPIFLPSGFESKYKRFILSLGDIIMSMTGTYGKRDYGFSVSIRDNNKYLLNQRVCKFLPKTDIDKLFLHYLLHTELYLKTLYLADGTKQANLDESDILDILVPIPAFPEQSRIASVLSSSDEAIEKEEAYKNKLLAIKRGLMEDLLSGKVRVNKLIKDAA